MPPPNPRRKLRPLLKNLKLKNSKRIKQLPRRNSQMKRKPSPRPKLKLEK